MKYSLNWLNKYTNLPVGDEKKLNEVNEIIDRIALQIVDVDERWAGVDDAIIDVDNKIITNRPYCFGHRGLAKEISVMLNQEYRNDYPIISFPSLLHSSSLNKNNLLPLEVIVEDPDLCPRFTSIVIKGIKIGPSPDYLKTAIESIGQRSINNLVDITNYIMLDTAQPVHAYDYSKIQDAKIIVRRAKDNEIITTLDGVERKLNNNVLLITDKQKAVGIAGVMGGLNSEIDNSTTDIVLEIASFTPLNIRQTAKLLKHRTDAVTRFEKGIDPTNIPNVMASMVQMILEICGGEIASEYIDIYDQSKSAIRVEESEMVFNPQRVDKLLGFNITIDFIKRIFNGFNIKYKENSSTEWILNIPTYKADIKEPADLVEDIGRMYGYQNIPQITPVNQLVIPHKNIKIDIKRKIQSSLLASGIDEVITYSFISQKDVDTFDLDKSIKIINPLSEDYLFLRASLIPSLSKIVSSNIKNIDEFSIFETSRIFMPKSTPQLSYDKDKGESMQPNEIEVISMMSISKNKQEKSIYTLKGALENTMQKLGIVEYSKAIGESFNPNNKEVSIYKVFRNGDIVLNNKTKIGKIGLLSQKQLDVYDIKYPASYLEIQLQPLIDVFHDKPKFKSFSKFPSSKLNYSVLVPDNTSADSFIDVFSTLNNPHIKSMSFTDIYSNKETLGDKKSFSLEFVLQKDTSNITDSEIYELGLLIEEKIKSMNNSEIRGSGVTKPKDYISSTNLTSTANKIIAAQVLSIEKHPNADRLVVTQVTTDGQNKYQIVTGATNMIIGDLVPVALPGASVPGMKNDDGSEVVMKIGKLRGMDSYGMMLAGDELGINNDHEGIVILDKNKYKLGDIVIPKDLI